MLPSATPSSLIYSAVLLPPSNIIEEINLLKQQLANEIGPFKGLHSDAHITLCTFRASDKNLSQWETHIQRFTHKQQPFLINFNRTECFSNGAFVFLPNENGHDRLRMMMRSFYKDRPKGKNNTSQRAHMSIARGLNAAQQEIARSITKDIEISFLCNNIALRKYNPESGLFALKEKYLLGPLNL